MYSITSRNGGKESNCDSYSGMGNEPTGRKFFRSALPGGTLSRQVSTVSGWPVLRGGGGQGLNGAAYPVDFRVGVGDPSLAPAGLAEMRRRGKMAGNRRRKGSSLCCVENAAR